MAAGRRTASLLRAALVAALIAVGALITVPLGPVPFTLQVLVVAVAALVLSPGEALAAVALYLGLGVLGVPVFSGGGAGPGVLLGPTGGFLAGFAVAAPVASALRRSLEARGGALADAGACVVLLAVVYAGGWAWFAAVTGAAPARAFALVVAPFVAIDAAKCVAAALVARAVRAALPHTVGRGRPRPS